MPGATMPVSAGLFAVSGLIEGAITLAVLQAIERLNPTWVRKPEGSPRRMLAALAGFAVLLAATGFLLASTAPDGIQHIVGSTRSSFHAPLADYQLPFWSSSWGRRAAAGITGLVLIFGVCAVSGKVLGRRKEVKCTT